MGVDQVRVAVVAGWFTCCSVLGTSALAQQTVVSANTPVESARRAVTVDVRAVQLKTALQTIAREAGLNVVFSAAVTESPVRVTMHVRNMGVEEAFAKALVGTNLRATFNQGDVLFVDQSSAPVPAAQGSISGRVVDAKTKQGVSGATVTIDDNAKGATSDDGGAFRFATVVPGEHTLRIRMLGYVKTTKAVTVVEGKTASLEIALEPSVNALDQVVVTGTVVATSQREVPSAITVITAKDIEARGITKIEQLFRGDVPGLFALNQGSNALLGQVTMFSRGATALGTYAGDPNVTNPIKTYVDGVEMVDPSTMNQIDPQSIERIEILTGPQASTIYGSNAMNGVMQIFTKRGTSSKPQVTLNWASEVIQNNFSSALAPSHAASAAATGIEGHIAYSTGMSWSRTGSWTPAVSTSALSGNVGARVKFGALGLDGSLRIAKTRNTQGGSANQTVNAYYAEGLWNTSFVSQSSERETVATLQSQTASVTMDYVPFSWWSHQLRYGQDVSRQVYIDKTPSYQTTRDTVLILGYYDRVRTPVAYSTTLRIPVTSHAQMQWSLGGDSWTGTYDSRNTNRSVTKGSLDGNWYASRTPSHNAGGFVQGQFGVADALFLTYGLRAEWNPNYGEDAQPNMSPRYGVAYTHEFSNGVTMKLRGSYGKATTPPAEEMKLSSPAPPSLAAIYGDFLTQLENPDLGPSFQQGGEGGVELYLGSRASLILTRYNQTVDGLISSSIVDSARSLEPMPSSCPNTPGMYCYYRISQYLNIGAIRNQGWESQATTNLGPLGVRGVYSWTKSRIIGITERYRALSSGAQYQRGGSFTLLPEHTWSLTTTYSQSRSSVSLMVNGVGSLRGYGNNDESYRTASSNVRLMANRVIVSNASKYPALRSGYAMADLNARFGLTHAIDGVLNVRNLTDYYRNDYSPSNVVPGRQTRASFVIRF